MSTAAQLEDAVCGRDRSRVGRYLRVARRVRGLSPQALAKLIGYENANKGARRVTAFEATGEANLELIHKLVVALGLDANEVERLATLDRQKADAAFDAWLAEPVEPELFMLPLLAIRVKVSLPTSVRHDRDTAAAYALRVAREQGVRAALVFDRRATYWVSFTKSRANQSDRDARPSLEGSWVETAADRPNFPYARLGGRPVTLTFE